MKFEWDPEKARSNLAKHCVTFEDAGVVFDSPEACLELVDELHADNEERFITLGPSPAGLLVVVWTERDGGRIRIISARAATPKERRLYRKRMERP